MDVGVSGEGNVVLYNCTKGGREGGEELPCVLHKRYIS